MPELERVQQNTPLTLSQQWYEDGVAVDPGTVTLGATRADGTVLVAAGQATGGSSTAARTFNLTTTHTAMLDRLTVTWTSTLKGTLVSYVEVVGGFLFTLADLTAAKPNGQTWTTARMVAMRTTVEQSIEDEYGTALVPRYERKTITGDSIRLRYPVRTIRSVTVDGTALDQTQLDDLTTTVGFVNGFGWAWCNRSTIIVDYEYGLDMPPARMSMAAIRLARQWLVNGPLDDRAASFSSADGGTYGLLVPGRSGSIFGLPDLDAAIGASPYRIGVA